jgi:hypothetical protein
MERFRLLAACLVTMAVISACSPPGGDEPSATPSPRTVTSNPPAAQQGPCRSVEPLLHDAARSVIGDITIARPGVEGDADRVEVIVCKTSDTRATATVTIFGQRDDSVRDTRHELVLDKLVVDGWVVSNDVTTHRCQPGRGHQEFSAELCL